MAQVSMNEMVLPEPPRYHSSNKDTPFAEPLGLAAIPIALLGAIVWQNVLDHLQSKGPREPSHHWT
jgi:hypothetical protein